MKNLIFALAFVSLSATASTQYDMFNPYHVVVDTRYGPEVVDFSEYFTDDCDEMIEALERKDDEERKRARDMLDLESRTGHSPYGNYYPDM